MSLPAGQYAPVWVEFMDASGESSRFSCWSTVLTQANWNAQQGLFTTMLNALFNLITGNLIATHYGNTVFTSPDDLPANGAQRELKLKVNYRDNVTGAKYHATIPTINISQLVFVAGAKDIVLMTSTFASTFRIAFQNFAKSPFQNAVIVTSMEFVGRNI